MRKILFILAAVLLPAVLHSQGSAFVANQQRTAVLPGNIKNISFVDGEFHCLASEVLLKANRNGEQLLGFWPDTLFARLQDNIEYVVRHPVSGDIYFTARDKKGRSFFYHCTGFGLNDEKVKMIKMGGTLFNKGMTVEHPTFTNDGRIVIFSSKDEKRRERGYDLWFSIFDGKQWSKPQNLGRRINTRRDEVAPLIYRDCLLFSSNGHDENDRHLNLYSTRLLSKGSSGDTVSTAQLGRCIVQRLPYPLNANHADDFGLAIDTASSCGYWVSRRSVRDSNFQIYSFSGALDGVLLWGTATDKIGHPLTGVTVTVLQDKKKICSTSTDQDGHYRIYLMCNQHYSLTFQLDNYFSTHDSINTAQADNEYLITESRHDVTLDRLPIGQRIYLEDLFGPDADVELSSRGIETLAPLVRFLNDNPSLKVDMSLSNDLTDNREFNMMLTDERIRSLEKHLYPLLPPTIEIDIENGCIGRDGCCNASGNSRLTVLINK